MGQTYIFELLFLTWSLSQISKASDIAKAVLQSFFCTTTRGGLDSVFVTIISLRLVCQKCTLIGPQEVALVLL